MTITVFCKIEQGTPCPLIPFKGRILGNPLVQELPGIFVGKWSGYIAIKKFVGFVGLVDEGDQRLTTITAEDLDGVINHWAKVPRHREPGYQVNT